MSRDGQTRNQNPAGTTAAPPFSPGSGLWLQLDASSRNIQAAIIRDGAVIAAASGKEEATQELGACVNEVLKKSGASLTDLTGFLHCHGPGSLLSIRIAAMTLRVWTCDENQPVYTYASLSLAAALAHDLHHLEDGVILQDARRGSWNCCALRPFPGNEPWPITNIATDELPTEQDLYSLENFPNWQNLPKGTSLLPYEPLRIWDLTKETMRQLLLHDPSPDSLLTRTIVYRTHERQIHGGKPSTGS